MQNPTNAAVDDNVMKIDIHNEYNNVQLIKMEMEFIPPCESLCRVKTSYDINKRVKTAMLEGVVVPHTLVRDVLKSYEPVRKSLPLLKALISVTGGLFTLHR
jgi:hypothetical protein